MAMPFKRSEVYEEALASRRRDEIDGEVYERRTRRINALGNALAGLVRLDESSPQARRVAGLVVEKIEELL